MRLCDVILMLLLLRMATASDVDENAADVNPCVEPRFTGPCRAFLRRFFYNSDTDECEEFTYGGCNGNLNNFETKLSCEARCKGVSSWDVGSGFGNDPLDFVTCRALPMDVVFIVDGSRSVRPHNFDIVRKFIKDIMRQFAFLGPKDTQVGLIQYGSLVRMEFPLNEYYNLEDMTKAVDEIDYMEMGTMTGEALKFLVTKFYTRANGARLDDPTVMKLAIVITDGRSQDRTLNIWQERAKKAGFVMYAIGVGRRVQESELLQIASEPKSTHKYSVQSFEAIQMLQVMLVEEVCDVDECLFGNSTCNQLCINTPGSFKCDCFDGYELLEDESTCKEYNACRDVDCMHVCDDVEPGVYRCLCHEGYALMTDEHSCGDIDECKKPNHGCEQICINTEGSYYCDCNEGYRLREDERTCESLKAPTPTNLQFSEVTHTSFRTSWELDNPKLLPLVESYIVTYRGPDGVRKEVRVTEPTVMLTDLNPETPYDVSVVALTKHDISDPGEGTQATLELGETELVLSKPSLTTLTATWEPADGDDLTGYLLTYRPAVGRGDQPGQEVSVKFGPETHSTVLKNLNPKTDYEATIIPIHANALSGTPGHATGRTLNLKKPEVTVIKTSLSTANVEWTDVGIPEDKYSLKYFPVGQPDNVKTIEISAGNTQALVRGLEPDTEYQFDVTGEVTESGQTFTSPVGSNVGKTVALEAPEVTIPETSLSTLDVEWEDTNDAQVEYYTVKYCKKSTPEDYKEIEVMKKSTKLEDLEMGTEYTVDVTANIFDDDTLFNTELGRAEDSTDSLEAPVVTVVGRTVSSLSVQWGDVSEEYEADFYTLTYYPKSDPEDVTVIEIDGSEHETVLNNLLPSTNYDVTVVGHVQENGQDIKSPQGMDSETTLALRATELLITKPTDSTMVISWTDIGCAPVKFVIEYHPVDDPTDSNTIEVSGDTSELLLTDLYPDTEYEITLIGYCMFAEEPFESPPVSNTESTEELKQPEVDANEPTITTIDVDWTAVAKPEDFYVLTYNPCDEPKEIKTLRFPSNVTSTRLEDLDPDTPYDVTVTVHSMRTGKDGDKEFMGEPGSDTETTEPLSPLKVDAKHPTITTIDVTWSDIGTPADYYSLTYHPKGFPGKTQTLQFSGDKTSTTLTELHPDTEYVVIVTGHVISDDEEMFQSPSGKDIERTEPLTKIEVTANQPTYTTINVAWTPVGIEADEFVIDYNPVKNPAAVETVRMPGDEFSTVLKNLDPDTEYEIRVKGQVTLDGVTHESPEGRDTETTNPLKAPVVAVTYTNMTTVEASWPELDGPVDYYIVELPEDGNQIRIDVPQVTFTGLTPGSEYTVEVVAVHEGKHKTIETPMGSDIGYTKPSPPKNPKVVVVTPTTATVTFGPSDGGSDFYEAICVRDGETPNRDNAIKIAGDLQVTCEGLDPAVSYRVCIWNVYRTMKSDPIEVSLTTVLPPPQDLLLDEPTTHSLRASWAPPEGVETVDSYILSYKQEGSELAKEITVSGDTTSVVLDELNHSTNYVTMVQAIVAEQRSSVATDEEPTLADEIDIEVVGSTPNDITVQWTASQVPSVFVYRLTYTPNIPDATPTMVEMGPTDTVNVINNVYPGVEYDISVVALYPTGQSNEPATQATPPVPPPGPLRFTDISDTGMVVHWGKPEDANPIGYRLTYSPKGTPEDVKQIDVESNMLGKPLMDLVPETTYDFAVTALYPHDVESDASSDSESTFGEVSNLETCDCWSYLTAQNQMTSVLEKLTQQISELTKKVDELQGNTCSGTDIEIVAGSRSKRQTRYKRHGNN